MGPWTIIGWAIIYAVLLAFALGALFLILAPVFPAGHALNEGLRRLFRVKSDISPLMILYCLALTAIPVIGVVQAIERGYWFLAMGGGAFVLFCLWLIWLLHIRPPRHGR